METKASLNVASCIGCGCNDLCACIEKSGAPCSWVRVDRAAGLGVCSACRDMVPRWDAGERGPRVSINQSS